MHEVVEGPDPGRRVRVGRGIYRQTNGKYVVCFMLDGKPRFRTVGRDLELARGAAAFVRARGEVRSRRGGAQVEAGDLRGLVAWAIRERPQR
jgi:hypothetical protein